MILQLPEFCAILLLRPQATAPNFAATHFPADTILSTQFFQDLIAPPHTPPDADALGLLQQTLDHRLKNRLTTLIDLAPLEQSERQAFRSSARRHNAPLIAIVLDLPAPAHLNPEQRSQWTLENSRIQYTLPLLEPEGLAQVFHISDEATLTRLQVQWQPFPCSRLQEPGPFDIIGSPHGCHAEFISLVQKRGYQSTGTPGQNILHHPQGRKLIVLGDLADRGPEGPRLLGLLMRTQQAGHALVVCGNQDRRLLHLLQDQLPEDSIGFEHLIPWAADLPQEERQPLIDWLQALPDHLVLDGGKLVAVHGGIQKKMLRRQSPPVSAFCRFGETPAETDHFGFPTLTAWTGDFEQGPLVLYAHQAQPEPVWINKTLNLDTGCVFGGKLTALSYPELELHSQPAQLIYHPPILPPQAQATQTQAAQDPYTLPYDLFNGRFLVQTSLRYSFGLDDQQVSAAMEMLHTETVSPRWLIYLPPSMSPPQPATEPPYLEHPNEGFSYYEKKGQSELIVQEKVDGVRAILILCKDAQTAKTHFGSQDHRLGRIYSRYGRPLLPDAEEKAFLENLSQAATAANLWTALGTDWLCIEGQLSPTAHFLPQQTATHQRIATLLGHAFPHMQGTFQQSPITDPEFLALRARIIAWQQPLQAYTTHLPTSDPDWTFVPYHLLASASALYFDQTHAWHLAHLERLCQHTTYHLRPLQWQQIDLSDHQARHKIIEWWHHLNATSKPGLIMKPLHFETIVGNEPIQPAIKVRTHEALRQTYGLEFDQPEALNHHRSRSLKDRRELAVRQYALGKEALQRFQARQPFAEVLQASFCHLAISTTDKEPLL